MYNSVGNHNRLSATQAVELMTVKQESFVHTLGIIRQLCDERIRDAATTGLSRIVFDVPKFVYGRDVYNHKLMGEALARDLGASNYRVKGISTRLEISWGAIQSSTPVMQRPAAPAPAKKKTSNPRSRQVKRTNKGKVDVVLNV